MSSQTPHPRTVLPAAERAERNRQIAAAKATGLTWPEVAERFDVSESTARRAAAEHAATAATANAATLDADAIVRRAILLHARALERLDRLSTCADSHSARVGAAGRVTSGAPALIAMLQNIGWIGDPGLARYYAEMARAARTVIALCDRHGISHEDGIEVMRDVPLMLRFAREEVAA